MRKDLITWCMHEVGATHEEWQAHKMRAASRFLWAPKPLIFGIKFMLELQMTDRESLMKIAVVSMQRNTKIPLVDLVRNSGVNKYLYRYKINYTNLYPTNRAHTYEWWKLPHEQKFVNAAIATNIERFKNFAFNLFEEEYEHTHNRHKVGRHLNEQRSPEQCTL